MLELKESDCFAAYSLPGIKDYALVRGQGVVVDEIDYVNGFLIAPFENKPCQNFFISNDHYSENISFTFRVDNIINNHISTKDEYITSVNNIINDLSQNASNIDKLVFSRIIEKPNFNPDHSSHFLRLVESYEDAFVFLYNLPGQGCWLGASPEILLSWTANAAQTTSLASTKSSDDPTPWNLKERKEQEIVTHYIEKQLDEMRLNYSKIDKEKIAGPIKHLCTSISITEKVDIDTLLERIHPTPAVCGSPYLNALDAIHRYEKHDRRHYCGYLGPVKGSTRGDLFVNLRSAELGNNKAHIYVGGGILKESDPHKEWTETLLKAETLLSILETTYI